MAQGVKKYRRPDGSTYEQYGGPKSAQDVEVAEKKPTPAASPSPSPSPGPTVRQTSSGKGASDVYKRQAQEAADEAVSTAEITEKIAPWLGKKAEQQEGGLGGRAAREAQKRSDLPADKAGDAVAEDAEKKKKKNPKGGY